jgi:hypothetical protein
MDLRCRDRAAQRTSFGFSETPEPDLRSRPMGLEYARDVYAIVLELLGLMILLLVTCVIRAA